MANESLCFVWYCNTVDVICLSYILHSIFLNPGKFNHTFWCISFFHLKHKLNRLNSLIWPKINCHSVQASSKTEGSCKKAQGTSCTSYVLWSDSCGSVTCRSMRNISPGKHCCAVTGTRRWNKWDSLRLKISAHLSCLEWHPNILT